ncbi:MAG: matrixin family metalloprotease [bacterium]|nr:matrixin family metalloprotease [bacterium]
MSAFNKISQTVIFIALMAGLGYYFRNDLALSWKNLNKIVSPCDQPINYSIGELDKRFGLSREEFIKRISQAALIWQDPVGKRLFSYAQTGSLKVNLIYDDRQEATNKLKALGININNNKAGFEALKSKYDIYNKAYQRQKTELDNTVNYYNEQKANYEDEVKAANRRGGAAPAEFAILDQERQSLNDLAAGIKQKQDSLNKTADDINALASVMNKLIRQLNLSVNNYNAVGAGASGEFQEGQYTSDSSGEKIDIFQYDSQEMLIRVLAHELGHALGLEHLNNPKAIMYYLNESGNSQITADDLTELKLVCKIK